MTIPSASFFWASMASARATSMSLRFASGIDFPPLQDPASYNLTQVLEQVKKLGQKGVSQ